MDYLTTGTKRTLLYENLRCAMDLVRYWYHVTMFHLQHGEQYVYAQNYIAVFSDFFLSP